MEKIAIYEDEYKPWGRVLTLTDGIIEAKVTLDMGPRIIYLALKDGENLMFEDTDDRIVKGGEYFDKNFGGRMWHIIGGHRLWKSPEDFATYYPDLGTVDYETQENSAVFVSEAEVTTGLIKSLGITLSGGGRMRIRHEFYNAGSKPIEAALWGLTVLKAGGTVYFPVNDRIPGFLPDRNYVLWPYTEANDKRLTFINKVFAVSQQPSEKPFKIGAFNSKGVAAYLNKGVAFVKKFLADSRSVYPDFGCNFEVYTDNNMIECESLSPVYRISKGKSAVHYEDWSLHPFDIAKQSVTELF
jgi:hypothetical protein